MAEATKEQLQAQVAQLTKDLDGTKHELATVTLEQQGLRDAVKAATAEKDALQGQLDAARSETGEVAGELNEAQELIAELQDRLAKAASIQAQSDTVIVSDGTDHYKVLAPKFRHKKVEYAAEQLRDNEALVQELVAAGVGFLHKIEVGE